MRRRRILHTYSLLAYLLSPVRSIPYFWYFCCTLDVNIMSDLDLESLSHTHSPTTHPSQDKNIYHRSTNKVKSPLECCVTRSGTRFRHAVLVCCLLLFAAALIYFPFRAISRVIITKLSRRPRPSCGPTCRLTPRSSTE